MTRRSLLQAFIAAGLLPMTEAQTTEEAQPAADEQVDLINKMRSYAESYEAGLPNFICKQVTTHYESGTKHTAWHKGDTVTAQLSFSNGQEHSAIKLINNKPAPPRVPTWRWHLSTAGEFGAILVQPFAEQSEAKFEWKGWETVAGQRTAVFVYNVDKENSTLKLSFFGVSSIVAYKGTVWADPNSGRVVQIQEQAVNIPDELQMQAISTLLQYAYVAISGKQYLLPAHAEIVERTDRRVDRNVIEFQEYRKFEAESTLTFDDPKP
jgi:hypothetical protein